MSKGLMMSASILPCLLIVSLVGGTLVTVDREERFTPEDLATVFESLHYILQFFGTNSDQVILDAVFGTRVIEGQMRMIWKKLMENRTSSRLSAVANDVSKLYKLANQVGDDGEIHVKKHKPGNFERLRQMIEAGFWEPNYDSRGLETSLLRPINGSDYLTGFQMGRCFAEALASLPGVPKCYISDYCWTLMTSMNYTEYSLTHQIIYLQAGGLMGCWPEMVAQAAIHAQPPPEQIERILCGRVMDEALSIQTHGFLNEDQDLFMEQIAVCGMFGFRDFAKKSWLERILSWQRPVGCFGRYQNVLKNFRKLGYKVPVYGDENEDPNNLENIFERRRYLPIRRSQAEERGQPEVVELLERIRRLLPIFYWPQVFLHLPKPQEPPQARFKRTEKRMRHDCLAHKTAVAGAALSIFVRFIIEDLMSQWLL